MKNTLLLIFLLISFNSFAKYTQTCKIKYETRNGWSKYYTVDVSFMSGSELNNATNSFNYDSFSIYGIVFWDNDQATIIKISTFTGCGTTVSESCIQNSIMNLEGKDQDKTVWEICIKGYCF